MLQHVSFDRLVYSPFSWTLYLFLSTISFTAQGGSTQLLPDFVVTGITITPASPTVNTIFTAKITVKNRGTAAGNGKRLTIWPNHASVQACNAGGGISVSVGTLAKGISKTFTIEGLSAESIGTKTLRAFVDSTCVTNESNEGNNQLTKSYSTINYSLSDLKGTWYLFDLISGDANFPANEDCSNGQKPGWMYTTATIDVSGNVSGADRVTDSLGNINQPLGPMPVIIDSAGVITKQYPETNGFGFHGKLKRTKNFIASNLSGPVSHTGTGVCGYHLLTWIKRSNSFRTADLSGTWTYHMLFTGNGANEKNGWAYGTYSIDSSGRITYSTITDSYGLSGCSRIVQDSENPIRIDSSGKMTQTGFIGAMTSTKDVFVGVVNMDLSDPNGKDLCPSQLKGPAMITAVKTGNTQYAETDLQGAWWDHEIFTGKLPNVNSGWLWASFSLGADGVVISPIQLTVQLTNPYQSGSATNPASGSLVVSKVGQVIGDPNAPPGIMTPSKDMIVFSDNPNTTNGWKLSVMMKK